MAERKIEKELTPEYYEQCADEIKGELPGVSQKVLMQRIDLIQAQMGINHVIVSYCEQATERVGSLYYELLGLEEGLRLVVDNQDPKPLITRLLSSIEEIVGQKKKE